jgi:hypothetical protein
MWININRCGREIDKEYHANLVRVYPWNLAIFSVTFIMQARKWHRRYIELSHAHKYIHDIRFGLLFVMVNILGFNSRWGLGIFLFITASRTALGPTHPPIQWAPGSVSLEVKRQGREADHSPPSSAEVKEWVELYIYSPNTPSWCGA